MSFQNKVPGVLNGSGALTDGETGSRTSLRIEKKHTHHFFMDASEDSNRKQTVHSVSDTPISTPASANISNFQSAPVHCSDRLRAPEPLRTFSFGDKDVFSLDNENAKSEKSLRLQNDLLARVWKDYFAGCTSEFPFLLRKSSNTGEDSIKIFSDTPSTPVSANTSSFQSAPVHYSDRLRAPEPLRTSSFGDKDVLSLGNENVKSERSLRLQNDLLARVWKDYFAGCTREYPFLLRKSSNTGEDSINATSLGLGIGNVISTGLNSAKGKKPVNPIDNTIKKVNGDCMPVATTSNKEIGVASRILIPDKLVEVEGPKEILPNTHISYQNNFPPDVPSLLSTGILDGVPVKYISGSREKTVTGVIKGKGYMCGCNDCKLSKNLNASEFERHAGCKTNRPNNKIYFESGRTIQAAVQELKKTPPEMYFEAIQNITGSSINPKNFQRWIEYLQAVKEYHLFAKNEVAKPF